ncbi:bifunctional diguanylate cyclase/phosphodiesterase [Ideonella sp. A 288]|uniref:putative bifunctional diguanylate cyclase/phosphodiesterase n=1 Tax=Ideonella sp. A 288 TaxID=1962181 RepID=UPI0011865D60|nr:GGDEF and EAL domain-containing protein [Ideonella sp. A 288]
MSETFASNSGVALVCNYDGLVTEVLWDDLEVSAPLADQSHMACLFDPGSVQKALGLIMQVKERGAAFGWELNVAGAGNPRPLNFEAAVVGNRILLLASATPHDESRLYDGLSHVISEQINSLRALSKHKAGRGKGKRAETELSSHFTHEMFRDMLELNNRLVNAERELARKNGELRRLSAVLRKDLHLAHRVLQSSGEAVVVTDHDRRVVDVNQAFTAITGFTKAEQLGTVHALGEPGQHPVGFIDAIWDQVARTGSWQGECTGRRKGGESFPRWLTVSAVPDDSGALRHYVINFSDITRLKHAEERWQRLAFYDSLTHLPNRVLFKDRLQQAMARARRDIGPLALLFIDLDEFKIVNDSLGHDAGDQLLCIAARRIEACVRQADSLARLGGDEFTVIMHGSPSESDVLHVCEKIIQAINLPFDIGGQSVRIGASIGIARFPNDGSEPDTLIKNADTAMYAAKSAGRNTSRYYSPALGEDIARQLKVKTQIAQGLQRGEFTLELQPVVDLAGGLVRSLEALLRWNHPERGPIAPDQFIPIAEDSGLIVELGEFVVRQAVQLARELRSDTWPQARVAVNVSRRQLAAPGLADFIVGELDRCGLPGSALIVEVTESMVMSDIDHAAQVLNRLREAGVSAAIDDFGTGYSSLNSLRRLPVEFLKIDKTFVADVDVSRESESIISAISAMAHGLGLNIVAEGVERQGQLDVLLQVGCDSAQGYWFARPMSLDKLRPLLGRDGRLRKAAENP